MLNCSIPCIFERLSKNLERQKKAPYRVLIEEVKLKDFFTIREKIKEKLLNKWNSDLLNYLQGNASSVSIDRNAPTDLGRPRPRNDMARPSENLADDLEKGSKQEQSERLRSLLEKGIVVNQMLFRFIAILNLFIFYTNSMTFFI